MEIKKEKTLKDIIEFLLETIKNEGEKELLSDYGWCIYGEGIDLELSDKCFIDTYPDYDDDDNEILPELVSQKDYELVYRDEMIQDVVVACYNQKKDCSIEEVFDALKYYDEHDSFLVL
jgi:hypothetical protein